MSVLQEPLTREGSATTYPEKNYLTSEHTVASWLLTTDHKRIAILYMISITLFFFLGGGAATLMRLELITPQGDLLRSDLYNRMFTLHGIVMVFFFMVPSIPAVLGNFLVPIQIGARDLAFPRINLLSWYIYVLGGMFTIAAIVGHSACQPPTARSCSCTMPARNAATSDGVRAAAASATAHPAGLRLCGIDDEPPPGSATSPTSSCIRSAMSRAILASEPQ